LPGLFLERPAAQFGTVVDEQHLGEAALGTDEPELDTADSEPTEDDEHDYRRQSAA
jgi:hypothetical protein